MNNNILFLMAALVFLYGGLPTNGLCSSEEDSSLECTEKKPLTQKQEIEALFDKIASGFHKVMRSCFAGKMFEMADADQDGFLSLAEMRSLASKIQPYMFNDKFNKENDKNKDGKLSLDEVKLRSDGAVCK